MALLLQLTQKLAHGFQAFWERYPRRDAKKDATKAWGQVVKDAETEQKIHAALDWQIPMFEQRERQFIPLPASWLRGERWEDERPTTTPNRPTAKVVAIKPQTTMAEQQMDAQSRIRSLIATGMPADEAKRQVFLAMGWIKE